jgi:hypothetical protein
VKLFVPTASASIDFSVWTVLDTMNRSMMAFEYIRFLAVDLVDANPFVTCASSDKPILADGVD